MGKSSPAANSEFLNEFLNEFNSRLIWGESRVTMCANCFFILWKQQNEYFWYHRELFCSIRRTTWIQFLSILEQNRRLFAWKPISLLWSLPSVFTCTLTFCQPICHKMIPHSFLLPYPDWLWADRKCSDHPMRKLRQNSDMRSVLNLVKLTLQIFQIAKQRPAVNNLYLYQGSSNELFYRIEHTIDGAPPIPFKDRGLLLAIILNTSSQGSREFNSFGPDIAQANER